MGLFTELCKAWVSSIHPFDMKDWIEDVSQSALSKGDVAAVTNKATGGAIGTAAATVDITAQANVAQTTAGQVLTLPNPTDASAGKAYLVNNIGSQSFTMLGAVVAAGASLLAVWTGAAWSKVG